MKGIFCTLILFFFSVFIFGETISIYKYDNTTSTWVLVNQISIASAEGNGNFSTAMISGNVAGFIPISMWQSNYGRIEMNVEITQSLSAQISFNSHYTNLTANVNGGWITDDLYVGLKSNDTLNFDYSISANGETYHHLNVGNDLPPSKWQKSYNLQIQRIRVMTGNHDLYLYLGFDPQKTDVFVGPVLVDTYVVPDI